MKFGPSVLLEIVAIVQEGLVKGVDISQRLRDIEVSVGNDGNLHLSDDYIDKVNADPEKF
jgi:hypothetical protein